MTADRRTGAAPHDRAVNIAVTDLTIPQLLSHHLKKGSASVRPERLCTAHDGIELTVAQSDWPHADPVTAFRSGIRDLAPSNKQLRNRKSGACAGATKPGG